MRSRALRGREVEANGGLVYVAELSTGAKAPHRLTGERCRTLTGKDLRDCVDLQLPMWDRGHSFVGATGAGSCLHVDQAWWSNIAKNFLGYKLVALWGPDETPAVVSKHQGELFRKPLSEEQSDALLTASGIALLRPGDVASFSGGLPHITMVVGDQLNVTAYESVVNWNPHNAELLLRGASRPAEWKGIMKLGPWHGLLDDIADVVLRAGAVSPPSLPPLSPAELLLQAAFRQVLLRSPRCARRLGHGEGDLDSDSSRSASSESIGDEKENEKTGAAKKRKMKRTKQKRDAAADKGGHFPEVAAEICSAREHMSAKRSRLS
ncbi:unnamed protein product [Polarella glacialis]|uniref:JmjC domain-containing protein n=1 Tax=Polarella glacialis TaxID=89957 RepID=A0A813GV52_POLGL|nr:unnamed protein product [Polarella glacialis]